MAFQTTFTDPAIGYAGERNDTQPSTIDHLVHVGSADIGFGKVVKKSGTGCDLPSSASDDFLGVASKVALVADDGTLREYEADDVVEVTARGRIYVQTEQTCTPASDVYVRVTAGGNGVGSVRVDSDGAVAGVTPQVSLTLSGGLDAGEPRIQDLTFVGDLITGNVVNLSIDGNAIAPVTYATSHAATMTAIVQAIELVLASNGLGGHVSLSDPTNNREIRIESTDEPFSATALAVTGIVVTAGASQTTGSMSDHQAGKAPHSLSITVDGDTVSSTWAGNSDATLALFAEQLQGQTKVATAVVTTVPTGDDLTVTLTGANAAVDDIDLAAAAAAGGATARTIAVNNEVRAGVAAVAAKAVAWTNAKFKGSASADGIVEIDVREA